MDLRKKSVILYDVALMEDHRSSKASSMSYRDSELPTMLKTTWDEMPTPQFPPQEFAISPSVATTAAKHRQKYRVLGTLGLTGIVYFSSCGGPVGTEPLMSAGGPLVGLLGILAYGVFCVIPLLFMITELCCAFPENGGQAIWAMNAFGPFWGFQSGYWSWIALIFNNAIFPSLIFNAFTEGYSIKVTSSVAAFFIKATIAIVLALPTYFSVRSVGVAAVSMLVFVLLGWAMMIVWGFIVGKGDWYRLGEVRTSSDITEDRPQGGIDWTLLVHTLHWSFNGLYAIASIGGEVINPARTYPRVYMVSLTLSLCTYISVWISTIQADEVPWLDLKPTALLGIVESIGGGFLHRLILLTSILALVGLFVCSFFSQTFLVQGMAQSQLLPSIFRKRHARFKTPQYAVYLSLAATLGLVGFDFQLILSMTNACSAAVELLMVLSMLQLRRSFPYLPRPIRMPGGTVAVALALLPITCVYIFLIVTTLQKSHVPLILLAFAVPGSLFPCVRARLAGYRICN